MSKSGRAKKTKLQAAVDRHRETLELGRVLAIDPSSGTKYKERSSSNPGYCLVDRCEYVESGVIEVPHGSSLPFRLYSIAEVLRNEFEDIDALVIEALPPRVGGSRNLNLVRSVGAIFGVFGGSPIIPVAPASWHAASRRLPFAYVKDDETDACMFMHTVYAVAGLDVDGLMERIRQLCED